VPLENIKIKQDKAHVKHVQPDHIVPLELQRVHHAQLDIMQVEQEIHHVQSVQPELIIPELETQHVQTVQKENIVQEDLI
jgi:hypothetical protein